MPVSFHPAWHPISAHFAVGFTVGTSLLVIIGLIARLLGYRDFARKLTAPIHVASLLSLITLVLVVAGALVDFPSSTFAASPWFKLKTHLAVIAFAVYAGLYTTVMLKRERIWDSPALLAYVVVLALLGSGVISVLGAAGGYLAYGHSVLEPLLKLVGFPLPRA